MAEDFDARILAGVEFIDAATGARLLQPLTLHSNSARFIRNQSNRYVLVSANGLETYVNNFENAPDEPAPGSINISVSVEDRAGKYLPRTFDLALPRDSDSANSNNANSVFQAIPVQLFRDVATSTLGNWSLVRVSVRDVENHAVAGAFILVTRVSDNEVLGRGMSNLMGETLIAIPGIPITQFSESTEDDEEDEDDEAEEQPVLVTEVAATVELSIPDTLQWPGNPDLLESAHAGQIVATQAISLRTGRTETLSFNLN